MPVTENAIRKKLVKLCENLIPRTAVKAGIFIYVITC